ncbi:hypothetical protein ACFLIM_12255 [Nonomuraea sp. M3C6]|uniref:Uncharacterized protein n=1 Tax=Nonomuraea marmarensis TaxID=3351344 RepID=A0ABW7A9D9_9ACTN
MSAIVLALGLAGAGATPFIVQSASASAVAYDPPVEPCDVGDVCDTTPQTTVTETVTGTPTDVPETTITKTVTASPTKKTKSPTPTKTTTPPSSTPQNTTSQNLQPLPSQSAEVPSSTPTTESSVQMPTVAPTETVATALPSETQSASSEAILELRQAAPEFDQRTLTQKLSIPALVLVLLALFAVLIFEGRLRRMAHAAAVRKAGPQMGRPDAPLPGAGYPAGPGYATAGFPAPGYPGGTAYAPIISFVPVQTYPSGQVQYGAVYQEPGYPYPHQGSAPEPPSEPVVLHPDEFDSYSHEPPPKEPEYRDPFEPVIPPTDIPPGGASPFESAGQEHPFGPASSAESGDSEPWQPTGPSLFDPAAKDLLNGGPRDEGGPGDYEPPPYVPADEDATTVQPLPPQMYQQEESGSEPTKEMPDSKRKRWGRKK